MPKDWKEAIYNQMMQIQSLKMQFGQITFRINENIYKYGSLFKKYKSDTEVGIKMTSLQNRLEQLKDIFNMAFNPLDYINYTNIILFGNAQDATKDDYNSLTYYQSLPNTRKKCWANRKKRFQQKLLKPLLPLTWAHLGLNQGPPDYESGALTS